MQPGCRKKLLNNQPHLTWVCANVQRHVWTTKRVSHGGRKVEDKRLPNTTLHTVPKWPMACEGQEVLLLYLGLNKRENATPRLAATDFFLLGGISFLHSDDSVQKGTPPDKPSITDDLTHPPHNFRPATYEPVITRHRTISFDSNLESGASTILTDDCDLIGERRRPGLQKQDEKEGKANTICAKNGHTFYSIVVEKPDLKFATSIPDAFTMRRWYPAGNSGFSRCKNCNPSVRVGGKLDASLEINSLLFLSPPDFLVGIVKLQHQCLIRDRFSQHHFKEDRRRGW